MSHTPGPWHVQFLGPQKADLIHKGTFAGISGGSGCPNHLDADDPIRDGTYYQASDEDRIADDWELM
jgi:hypothetical protein